MALGLKRCLGFSCVTMIVHTPLKKYTRNKFWCILHVKEKSHSECIPHEADGKAGSSSNPDLSFIETAAGNLARTNSR